MALEVFMAFLTALLIIDVQKGFDASSWGKRNNLDAEKNIQRLLEFWRSKNRPVIHVQHSSKNPQSTLYPKNPGWNFKNEAMPKSDEPVFHKDVNSAFIGTNLEKYLIEQSIRSLVITIFGVVEMSHF
jgi:nicotinamidase-related amidase